MSQSQAQGKSANLNNPGDLQHYLEAPIRKKHNQNVSNNTEQVHLLVTPQGSSTDERASCPVFARAFSYLLHTDSSPGGCRHVTLRLKIYLMPSSQWLLKKAVLPAESSGRPLHSDAAQATIGKTPALTLPWSKSSVSPGCQGRNTGWADQWVKRTLPGKGEVRHPTS